MCLKLIRAKIQVIFDADSCRQVLLWKNMIPMTPQREEKKLLIFYQNVINNWILDYFNMAK